MSKFSLNVLQSCVFRFVETDDPDVILGAAFGEDVGITRVAPRWILLLVLVPRMEDEDLLEEIIRDASRAAGEVTASIIGGHTGYSAGLSRPMVSVTALGTLSGRQAVRTGGARVGDHVLVTKGIALEGTAILAHDFSDVALRLGLGDRDLAEARRLMAEVSIVPEAVELAAHGVTAMHDVTRGGLLETLMEIAYLSGVGIEVDVSRLLVRPVVSRFAEPFQFDPLRMISSGTLAATVSPEKMEGASRALAEVEVAFADVGRVID